MENTIDPHSEIPTASYIRNMIPDHLRKMIDPAQVKMTGANYLTLTEVGVMTPSGEAVEPGSDLNQIAIDFESAVNSQLAADPMEIPAIWLKNSAKLEEVTHPFLVEDLTNIATTLNVNQANVFTDANQLQSWLSRISSASLGAQQGQFCDADDDDNLIEITSADAAQLGGLRAWGGKDKIMGTEDKDIANGNAGNDIIVGAGGEDMLQGGEDDDLICGGEGHDLIMGNQGDDSLFGGAGNDVIRGGLGVDVLMGHAGDDILIGDSGADFLMGGDGADKFILRGDMLTNDAALADRILDFNFNPSEGDTINIAYWQGTQGMGEISFAAVDVNQDNIQDTAILCPYGVVGVIMSKDLSEITPISSIYMGGSLDTTLTSMGESF